jgi:hypothetical protein
MLANNHSNGILWITELSAPEGGDPGQDIDHHQAQWLVQAYQQLRSQLFIGVVFYETINPANSGGPVGSLLSTGPRTHPFFGILKQLIAQNNRDYDVLQLTETQVKNINKENP